MSNRLPQDEEDSGKRQQRTHYLQNMQAIYQFSYEYANTIAVVKKLPWREIPGLRYWLLAGVNLARLIPSLPALARTFFRYWMGHPLAHYQDYIFYPRSPQPDTDIINNFQHDRMFGLQRVIGVNPTALRALGKRNPLPPGLSLEDIQTAFAELPGDIRYETAVRERRVYILDYAELSILKQNPGQIDGGRQQYITTPIVILLQQDDGLLQPVAIQPDQGSQDNPQLVTPKAGEHWLAAKTLAQIADGNHHILYTHATRIHYVMEAFIMASRRQLYKTHPLYVLLNPHLQFTLNVNHQHTFLRNRKGQPGRFGEIFAGDYEATTQCMANAMSSYNFKASAFTNDIASRDVDNPDLFYPYRDDGLLLWNAIQAFAQEYIDLYYESDEKVAHDDELGAWTRDISAADRGRINGFPTNITTRVELANTIGHIIFLCTAHHSCIHFNQYNVAGFVPNLPYACYLPPSIIEKSTIDDDLLFRMQPALRAAYTQTWTYFMTNFRVNQLGQYPLKHFDTKALATIAGFQHRLKEIEKEISMRNNTRPVSYDRLKPGNIPNSVSV